MKIVTGDLLDLFDEGEFNIIIHGCNCFNTMGAGIAKQIKKRYPKVYAEDCKTFRGDIDKLGTCVPVVVDNKVIVNAYTQYKYYGSKVLVDYEAVRKCFHDIVLISNLYYYTTTSKTLAKIGYPKIGSDLAGGDWDIISKIIDEELEGFDHTLVLWDK